MVINNQSKISSIQQTSEGANRFFHFLVGEIQVPEGFGCSELQAQTTSKTAESGNEYHLTVPRAHGHVALRQ